MPMNGTWDATQFQPKQVGESHPIGKFPFSIANTEIVPTKDQKGGMFVVTFQTPAGTIAMRYNLWNESAKAVEIAHGQLSALCHATGVFKLDWQNDGAALRNAKGMIDVGYQKGEEPSADKPHGGYTEVKKVLDANGNEPGKPPQAAPQAQAWTAPKADAAPSGWGAQNQPNPNPPNPAPGGWQQNQPQNNPPWAKPQS